MKNTFFKGKIYDRYSELFTDQNEDGKKQYYMLYNIRNSKPSIDRAKKLIAEENEKNKVKARLVAIEKQGVKYPFVLAPISMVEARYLAFRNRENNLIEKDSGVKENISSEKKKKVSNKVKVALATGMATLALFGVIYSARDVIQESAPKNEITEQQKTFQEPYQNSSQKAQQNMSLNDIVENMSYDDLTYGTYQNSKGVTLMEMSDALLISNVCFNNVMDELEKFNASVSESKRYAFDKNKFNGAMFAGFQHRESSFILSKDDINKPCKGPFQISAAGAEEANEVCRKLTGKNVIESVDDLYDPVKACRACIYIVIKNYQYAYTATENVIVTPSMPIDTYLWGCKNVRQWIREGSYSPKMYSQTVLKFGEVLDEYWNLILENKTDGSHDQYWKECNNKLDQVIEWSKAQSNQMGE